MLQYALPPPVVMGSAPKVPVVKVVALKVPVAKVVTFKVPEKSTEVEIQEDEFDMVDYGMQGKVKRVRRTERFVVSRVWTKRGGYSYPCLLYKCRLHSHHSLLGLKHARNATSKHQQGIPEQHQKPHQQYRQDPPSFPS